jgi:Collagen triple helix repeat (20 copies)
MMVSRVVTEVRRNIVAWLALFVALSGTSLAASHYVITSTKQIEPSALKQLRGARGPAGPQGPAGASGADGASGTNGTIGAQGLTGKEGPPGVGLPGITGVTGPEGKLGPTGPPGTEGKPGPMGPPGAEGKPGTALAYAHVTAAGKVEPSGESTGFTGVTIENPPGALGEGVYCISGLSGELHNVVVTPDGEASEPRYAIATLGKSHYVEAEHLCSSTTPQITVEVWDGSSSPTTKNAPFFIDIN